MSEILQPIGKDGIIEYIPDLLAFLRGSFGICMNANDFFSYASADSVILDPKDLNWVLPVCRKYPKAGENACMSYIAKRKPIKPWITPEFESAYAEIEAMNPDVQSEY